MITSLKILARTGDRDPVLHGGGVIAKLPGALVWEWCYASRGEAARSGEATTREVFSCAVPSNVCETHDWADWSRIATHSDVPLDVLCIMASSPDVVARVQVLEMLAGYYGPADVSSYETSRTEEELAVRWALDSEDEDTAPWESMTAWQLHRAEAPELVRMFSVAVADAYRDHGGIGERSAVRAWVEEGLASSVDNNTLLDALVWAADLSRAESDGPAIGQFAADD